MNHSRNRDNYENMTVDEITELQMHLEQLKNRKMNRDPYMDRMQEDDTRRRQLSRMEPMPVYNGSQMRYNNPYEYGQRKPMLEPAYRPHIGPYSRSHPMASSNHLRNIDVENSLIQPDNPNIKQRRNINPEIDRFERLPYNPQQYNWPENLPRGGQITRREPNYS